MNKAQEQEYAGVTEVARSYYNSEDADNFYYTIWGGEDIHVGLYTHRAEEIREASRRTVSVMAAALRTLDRGSRVIDLGAGYGGAARYLARNIGCRVACLNLSEVENQRNRRMNEEQGVGELIEVRDGTFEDVPYADESFDVVWSQDAFLHSGDRRGVLAEIARILRPGGEVIFTDPMQDDDCPQGVLQPVLDRIHLDSMGSIGFYRQTAAALGLREVGVLDFSHQLPRHYGRVREELERSRDKLRGKVSDEYAERMHAGLGHWVEAGDKGYLRWGILHFSKPLGS